MFFSPIALLNSNNSPFDFCAVIKFGLFIHIYLFFKCIYEGEATGGGGTPDFGVSIYFNDQIQFQVNEFAGGAANGSVFEVFWIGIPFGSAFYVKNDEMYSFIKELIDLYI